MGHHQLDTLDEQILKLIADNARIPFLEVAPTVWQEKSRESHPADEKHPCPYAFVDYIRR